MKGKFGRFPAVFITAIYECDIKIEPLKMSIRSELIESFNIFGTLSEEVLSKCVELCNSYSVTAEDLADQWGAYSACNSGGAIPTLVALDTMERKEYMRQQNKDFLASKKTVTTPTAVRVYKGEIEEFDADTMIVNSYSTPKSVKNIKRIHSPDDSISKKRFQPENLNFSPRVNFSPSSYSPIVNSQTSDYADRVDSGSIMLSYGSQNLQSANFKRTAGYDEKLVSVGFFSDSDRLLTPDARYMYEVMNAKASSLNSTTEWLGQCLIKKYGLEDPQPFIKASGSVTTYGRICCDGEGRLNAASVLLESTQELGRGSTIHLNLNKLSNYAVFPGQVVAVQGFSPNGNTFIAQKLFTDASPSIPLSVEHPITMTETVQIVVAAGPFTLRDNLAYQPLQDLMKYVSNNIPHVLVLVGPFIDASHDSIRDATMAESFDTFFETLVGCIMTPLEGLNVQVVLLASQKDAHHHVVYPTPPYHIRKKYPNLQCVPDPSLLNIEGLILGATSADVLFHLGKEEVCSSSQSGDRMSRLAAHVLGQQSFYPLYPPDENICIDHELLEQYAMMDVLPHILIVPSNLRYFIKHIGGSVVINPERLAKGYVGGTFARIQVFPPKKGELLTNNIVAQIVRV